MKHVTRQIFYSGLIRFLTYLFVLAVFPVLALKACLIFYPVAIGAFVDILLLIVVSATIIGGCFYVLFHYSRINKTLEPVTRMAEMGELAARVAHDLRSPLSGIQAAAQFLHELKDKNPEVVNYLNLLELSSNRLEKIAQDMLTRYRGVEEEKTVFELHEILDELIGEFAAQPVLAGIHFFKNYSREPIALHGFRSRAERMFGNIMKNAIEAMNFEGSINISTSIVEERTLISIKDTGPGMTSEKIEKIFAGGFTEGKKNGHGIGLTFVREVIADHQGVLRISSTPGEGSDFQMEFPLAKELPVEFVLEVPAGESVLIIDDDHVILEQWRLALVGQGKETLLAESYEDFMAQNIAAGSVQTAIVDYHFENSELNGMEVIAKLKELGFENLYLCTVEYWKPYLKKQAAEMGVKICPKPLPKIQVVSLRAERSKPVTNGIASSPSEIRNDKQTYKILVIDDDLVIRMGWELKTKKLGIESLYAFENLEQLLDKGVDLSAIDLAFVDKNIKGSQFNGAECIAHLRKWGAKKIVLASGEDEESLRKDPAFKQADFIISEKIPDSFKTFFS